MTHSEGEIHSFRGKFKSKATQRVIDANTYLPEFTQGDGAVA